MIAPINQLPDDTLRLIFLEVANPKIGRVCRKWKRLNTDKIMISLYLKTYEAALGPKLFAQFTQRMHEWDFKYHEGFKNLLKHQWSLISYYMPKAIAIFGGVPLSHERVNAYEKRIAEIQESDLYSFCLNLLKKIEVHLENEGFIEGIKIVMLHLETSKERTKQIQEGRLGTKLWSILQRHIDLSIIKELTLDNSMRSVPIQIKYLAGLENLTLSDSYPYYIPAEILLLPNLKLLDLGRNKKHYLAPEIRLSSNPVIVNALKTFQLESCRL